MKAEPNGKRLGRRWTLPAPRTLPWALKPLESAETSLRYDAAGRMVMHIRHDIVKGVTPSMVAWWFGNIGGDVEIEGVRLTRYLAWHPQDHIHWELVRPGPSGKAGAGADFRIIEAFGRDPRFLIDVVERVEKLDETGIVLVGRKAGRVVTHLQHDFSAVEGGTRYVSTLTVGVEGGGLARALNRLVHRHVFPEAMGRAWLKHNIEEVGLLEHLIPLLHPSMQSAE